DRAGPMDAQPAGARRHRRRLRADTRPDCLGPQDARPAPLWPGPGLSLSGWRTRASNQDRYAGQFSLAVLDAGELTQGTVSDPIPNRTSRHGDVREGKRHIHRAFAKPVVTQFLGLGAGRAGQRQGDAGRFHVDAGLEPGNDMTAGVDDFDVLLVRIEP